MIGRLRKIYAGRKRQTLALAVIVSGFAIAAFFLLPPRWRGKRYSRGEKTTGNHKDPAGGGPCAGEMAHRGRKTPRDDRDRAEGNKRGTRSCLCHARGA